MVTIEFLGPIQKESITLEVSNLCEIADILRQDMDVALWLETCAVAVNDKIVTSRDIELKAGDKISLLPPVCGG